MESTDSHELCIALDDYILAGISRTAIEISVADEYNTLEPTWGEDGADERFLSYAASSK